MRRTLRLADDRRGGSPRWSDRPDGPVTLNCMVAAFEVSSPRAYRRLLQLGYGRDATVVVPDYRLGLSTRFRLQSRRCRECGPFEGC